MTNGTERLDRIEGILEEVAAAQKEAAAAQKEVTAAQKGLTTTLDEIAAGQKRFQEQVEAAHRDFAVRQQYHDEAFERHDAEMKRHDEEMKEIRAAIAADAENIRALARIAGIHNQRLDNLEGGTAS
jgi:chromosome segregation ATPase